jgi:hypothetical protein
MLEAQIVDSERVSKIRHMVKMKSQQLGLDDTALAELDATVLAVLRLDSDVAKPVWRHRPNLNRDGMLLPSAIVDCVCHELGHSIWRWVFPLTCIVVCGARTARSHWLGVV